LPQVTLRYQQMLEQTSGQEGKTKVLDNEK